jgi:type IV secretory pathway TrbD component
MNKHVEHIVLDLLPLYQEGLLSDETTEWLEKQLQENNELKQLAEKMDTPLEKEQVPIQPKSERDKMFKKINRKLAIFQIVFIAISFILAMQTSLLNGSFGFILWYTVLGTIVYLFYSDMKMVFLLSFIPIFIWSIVNNISNYMNGYVDTFDFKDLLGIVSVSTIHFLFALIGSVIGLIIMKLKEKEGVS